MSGLPKPENGRITKKGNMLYYHIMEPAIGSIPLYGVSHNEVSSLRLLADGRELKPAQSWMVSNYPDIVFVDVSASPELPDAVDTVVRIECR